MITGIIASMFIGLLVGLVIGAFLNRDPFPMNIEDFERQKRLRAENEAIRLYVELEELRRKNIRLANYPIYNYRKSTMFEIEKLPRVQSPQEAEEKYGEKWQVTDAIIGKINQIVSEVNYSTNKNNY